MNLSDIALIANNYSSLITAIATVALVIVTGFYIIELRNERKFKVRKEHTERLKEKVVKPWLEELNSIENAKKEYSPLPRKRMIRVYDGYNGENYNGENLNVEKCLLFNDLRNHVDSILFQTYERFKKNCRELSEENKNLENKMELYLKDKFEFLSWDEFYSSGKQLENGFFEKDFTLKFFLGSLLSGCKCAVEFNIEPVSVELKNSEKVYHLHFRCMSIRGKYWHSSGKYIDKVITDNKKAEIKNILEKLLEITQIEFKSNINEIHGMIEKINNDKQKVLIELEKIKEKSILYGECEFI